MKRLFRKVNDKSSHYDSQHSGAVRRDGSYIYEEVSRPLASPSLTVSPSPLPPSLPLSSSPLPSTLLAYHRSRSNSVVTLSLPPLSHMN